MFLVEETDFSTPTSGEGDTALLDGGTMAGILWKSSDAMILDHVNKYHFYMKVHRCSLYQMLLIQYIFFHEISNGICNDGRARILCRIWDTICHPGFQVQVCSNAQALALRFVPVWHYKPTFLRITGGYWKICHSVATPTCAEKNTKPVWLGRLEMFFLQLLPPLGRGARPSAEMFVLSAMVWAHKGFVKYVDVLSKSI